METASQSVTGHVRWSDRQALSHLLDQCRRHAFVGVEDQRPRMFERDLRQAPVALIAEAGERVLKKPSTNLAAQAFGGIGAERVHDDDIVAPAETAEAVRQVRYFVECKNEAAYRSRHG